MIKNIYQNLQVTWHTLICVDCETSDLLSASPRRGLKIEQRPRHPPLFFISKRSLLFLFSLPPLDTFSSSSSSYTYVQIDHFEYLHSALFNYPFPFFLFRFSIESNRRDHQHSPPTSLSRTFSITQ